MKLLNPFLEKYKPSSNNNIYISDIISALKIFSDNKCTPLFLKDLYFKKIYFPSYLNSKFEDNSMFINLNNILLQSKIKDDKNNEVKRNIVNNLLCIYGYIYYKYNKEKFSELIKEDDIFRASVSRFIGSEVIKVNDLVNQKLLDRNQVIPFIIENTISVDDFKNIFQNCKNIIEALESLIKYYDLFNKALNQKENNKSKIWLWNWFSSNGIEINWPKYTEKDDIDTIFNLINQNLEKVKVEKTNLISLENLIKQMIDSNENSLVKNFDFNKDKLKDLNDSIHDVGISLSIRNKFSNDEIINFIEKDIYYIND